MQTQRKKLFVMAIIVASVLIVAVLGAILLRQGENQNNTQTTDIHNTSPNPQNQTVANEISSAKTLQFSISYTVELKHWNYTVYAIENGDQNYTIRQEGLAKDENVLDILNETSFEFFTDGYWHTVNGTQVNSYRAGNSGGDGGGLLELNFYFEDSYFQYLKETISQNWQGTGDCIFSDVRGETRIFNIQINPQLDNSLFTSP
jgi:hypothetical protein